MTLKSETLAAITEQMRSTLLKYERTQPAKLLTDARFLLDRWYGDRLREHAIKGAEREVALQVAALMFVAIEAMECSDG